MRVLQLIDSLAAGGAERVAVNLANELVEYAEWSGICATREEGPLKETLKTRVCYTHLNKKFTLDPLSVIRLIKIVNNNKVNIIHAHSTSFFLAWIISIFKPKIKLIWHDHYGQSEYLNERPLRIIKYTSNRFNAIIAVNQQLEKWALQNLDCKKVFFIPNFVSGLISEEPQTELEGCHGKRIICLANLRPQKDHLTLIRAFAEVHKLVPDWTLHLIGKDFEDDNSKEIHKAIKDLELYDRVFVYGSRPDINNILKQCSIGVLSSISEGLPLSLLEYGQNGLAVISTNTGQCSWVIKDMGLIVNPKKPDELLEALLIYIRNETKRKEDANNFQKHVINNFSADASISKIVDIYEECLV